MIEVLEGCAWRPQTQPWLPYSLVLSTEQQHDKALALGMMHDLQPRPPFKRRLVQSLLAGRRWPAYGENEFFRKAVRRQELYWLFRRGGAQSYDYSSQERESEV